MDSNDTIETAVFKARTVGGDPSDGPISQQIPTSADELGAVGIFDQAGAIRPPYDFDYLVKLYEHSSSLRQCIDSYATNIDAFGHRLEPLIDLRADDAGERIANALYMQRAHDSGDDAPWPTDKEIEAERQRLEPRIRAEYLRLSAFLDFACIDYSFVTLRRRLRQDIELLGNAFVEVLRDDKGRVCRFSYVPAYTMRLMPLSEPVQVEQPIRISDIDYADESTQRRFRGACQVMGQRAVHFKEFGDPRTVSRQTGRAVDEKHKWTNGDGPATEIVHFRLHNPRTPYGIPRWVGTIVSIIGQRESEEVNRDYFERKAVPPLAIAVSGGRFSDEAVKNLENHIANNIRGKQNFHKILLLEAESATAAPTDGGGARTRIQFFPLTDAQLKDALFQNYDIRATDKVGFTFRLPRLLRGDVQEVNRSTSDAALAFAESQVFEPERREFDDWMNRHLLPALGVRYHRFVSNGPLPRDSNAVAGLVKLMADAGAITINEARGAAADVFNHRLPKIDEDWADLPLPLAMKATAESMAPKPDENMAAEGEGGGNSEEANEAPEADDVEEQAKRLIEMRKRMVEALATAEADEAARALH